MFNRLANQLEKRKWKYAYGRNLGATTCVCVRAYALECLLLCGSIPRDSLLHIRMAFYFSFAQTIRAWSSIDSRCHATTVVDLIGSVFVYLIGFDIKRS